MLFSLSNTRICSCYFFYYDCKLHQSITYTSDPSRVPITADIGLGVENTLDRSLDHHKVIVNTSYISIKRSYLDGLDCDCMALSQISGNDPSYSRSDPR